MHVCWDTAALFTGQVIVWISFRVQCPYSCVTTFLEYSDMKQLYGPDMYKTYTCALKYNKLTSTFSSRSVLYRSDLNLKLSREFLDQKYCWLGWLTVPSAGKFGQLLKWLIISQMMAFCVTILQILLGD